MKTNLYPHTYSDLLESINCFLSKFCRDLERFLIIPQTLEHIPEHINLRFSKITKFFIPMNMITQTLPLAMLLLLAIGCNTSETLDDTADLSQNKIPRFEYQRYNNGKIKFANQKPEIFAESSLDSLDFPEFNDKLVNAIESQLKVLKMRKSNKNQRIAGLDVSIQKLESTIDILLDNAKNGEPISKDLAAYQTWGKDKKGHVKYTGYFTPEIKVKKTPDAKYKYPLYRKPKNWEGKLPTRAEIDGEGALEGLGLELAYAKNPVDIYYMQVQGSGYAKFVDTGEKILFRFNGGNGKKYKSIEKYILRNDHIKVKKLNIDGIKRYIATHPEQMEEILFSNPSYTFFRPTKSAVKGAAGVPLVEDISIAADPKYFPLGSVVLASVPNYDKKGKITDHEFRILLPQDTGAAIRGAGHVDIYSGLGTTGKYKASSIYHYGNMWILLPQENTQLAMK